MCTGTHINSAKTPKFGVFLYFFGPAGPIHTHCNGYLVRLLVYGARKRSGGESTLVLDFHDCQSCILLFRETKTHVFGAQPAIKVIPNTGTMRYARIDIRTIASL